MRTIIEKMDNQLTSETKIQENQAGSKTESKPLR